MSEHEDEPYWQDDRLIGEARIHGEQASIRLRVHLAQEDYYGRDELIRLRHPTGTRTYVHGRPYVLVPDITLTMATYPQPQANGAVGEVLSSEWEAMRHLEVGNAQAWYYPQDRVVMLWECFLFEHHIQSNPTADPTLTALWSGFEGLLQDYFPHARRIVTPSWEDIYDRDLWQGFLAQRGYRPTRRRIFAKLLTPVP
jgi:hypothetical protein